MRSGQIIQLRRRATGEVILARMRWCSSFLCRLRGLTWRAGLAPDEGLVLVEAKDSQLDAAIHMFFVFFPIAAIWLDSNGRVVDTRLARPWRPLYVARAPARYVVEAAPALLEKISVGEELDFAP
ncbi:MAG: DUF192 domain-containing protein [Chloroflexi bacterium]|nr:DUF192 domain-containing protein [Chloroflexota bacterium]MBI3760417.1 DUF192 domain-containing protein [Chloroflexota bacterium]